MPRKFANVRVIPGEEAPGEWLPDAQQQIACSYHALHAFHRAVKELVEVYVADITGPQASLLVSSLFHVMTRVPRSRHLVTLFLAYSVGQVLGTDSPFGQS